jgi:hypothetical protein
VSSENSAGPARSHGTSVPLRVLPSDATSTGTVAITVAFPRALGLRSVDRLALLDASGAVLSAQIEALSRWGSSPSDCEAPIRFAHAVAVGGTPARLVWTPSASTTTGGIAIEESDERVEIDTGAARFEIARDERVRFTFASTSAGSIAFGDDAGQNAALEVLERCE